MTAAAVLNYQAAYTRLRDATTTQIEQLWTQLGGLSDVEAARFVAAATASMRGSETATARLVAAYLEFLAREEGPMRFPPLDLTQVTGRALRGVDPAEVFHRPVVTARTAISKGVTFQEAMRLGRLRAGVLGQSNVMLAQRATTVDRLRHDPRVVGYRRVLTGASCPLCATVSTQRYHRGNLMPLHDHCDCSVAPIYGSRDPGQVINSKLLGQLKSAGATGRKAPDVTVHTHGELGPVLAPRGQHFTGPADL